MNVLKLPVLSAKLIIENRVLIMSSHQVIQYLKEDHKYMLRLLYQMEQGAKALGGLNHQKADLDHLLSVVDYIKEYSDLCHHPVEEQMFSLLKSSDLPTDARHSIDAAFDDHELLEDLAKLLEATIADYIAQTDGKLVALIKVCNMYVKQQIRHIEMEQMKIFPLCESALNEADWAALEATIESIELTESHLSEYQTLRSQLMSRGSIGVQ